MFFFPNVARALKGTPRAIGIAGVLWLGGCDATKSSAPDAGPRPKKPSMGAQQATPRAPTIPSAVSPRAQAWATLTIEVEPQEGIVIELDGQHVADRAPHTVSELAPGPHTVVVRGMGHYPVSLPVTLTDGALLQLPVALRRRPPIVAGTLGVPSIAVTLDNVPLPAVAPLGPAQAPWAKEGGQQASPASRSEVGLPARAHAPPHVAATAHGLSGGMSPVHLTVLAEPAVAVFVAAEEVDPRHVVLQQDHGQVVAGAITLDFWVRPGRILDITIPIDGAQWFKDGMQIKGKSQLRLAGYMVRLRRVDMAGMVQSVVLRRLD